ncbi:uncharacterized protein LOC124812529 [Hydra vulgaris]|uniref:uncharacterized protein LOC124812529 n=1 Tax=Hydra vulgaris TaxID=6087 RepID=UPI0032EA873F
MVKAVLVKHLGERKIVIANNSISKKFASTSGNICGITWNGCNVDEDTFVAILNKQNLEVEALSLPVSKLYSSSFCQSLNDFSPVKNPVYIDLENFHASSPQQCLSLPVTNLESTAHVTEPVFIQEALPQKCAFSQSSLAGISSQPSYTAQVALTSNPLTNAIQKIDRTSFVGDVRQQLINYFPPHIKHFVSSNSVVEDKIVARELMACLLSFCFSHIPTHAIIENRVLLHKTFFSKLKSICLSLYPCYGQRWDLIFKKLLNNYRQRQYTKCHSLKVKRKNNNRKLKPVVTELVANQKQLLKDVEVRKMLFMDLRNIYITCIL